MIARVFHRWERRLAAVDTNRIVRPFEWGLDWLDDRAGPAAARPEQVLAAWAAQALADSDRFFALPDGPSSGRGDRATPSTDGASPAGDVLVTFPSGIQTPHPENNEVSVRYFPGLARVQRRLGRRAVVVLPQWNADAAGHVALCQLLARFGISAARLSLPYHDRRMPAGLERADFIVSSNVGQTLQVNRQAVIDARSTVAWLARQGYERIGILGTSLGSCLAMLTTAHEPRVRAAAFNHVSPYFADVVWEGLATSHVRAGLEGSIALERLRELWMPISPYPYIDRVRGRKLLLVYALYDTTFPVRLSRDFVAEFRSRGIPFELGILPCGHYTTGVTPFKYLDAFYLTRFFFRVL